MKVSSAFLILFLSPPLAFPAASASDWPTVHGNAARDGAAGWARREGFSVCACAGLPSKGAMTRDAHRWTRR